MHAYMRIYIIFECMRRYEFRIHFLENFLFTCVSQEMFNQNTVTWKFQKAFSPYVPVNGYLGCYLMKIFSYKLHKREALHLYVSEYEHSGIFLLKIISRMFHNMRLFIYKCPEMIIQTATLWKSLVMHFKNIKLFVGIRSEIIQDGFLWKSFVINFT